MSQKETINNKIEKLNQEIEWFYGNEFSLDEAQKRYREPVHYRKKRRKPHFCHAPA